MVSSRAGVVTSICSNALLMLGAQTVASTSDGTDRSTLAANLYESARDSVLRSHPWNCATKRVVLAPDSAAPAFGYAAQFALPSDFLLQQMGLPWFHPGSPRDVSLRLEAFIEPGNAGRGAVYCVRTVRGPARRWYSRCLRSGSSSRCPLL